MIKITSVGGVGIGTTIHTEDGRQIDGITHIEVRRFGANDIVRAVLEIDVTEVDIEAHPLLSERTVREAMPLYGIAEAKDVPMREAHELFLLRRLASDLRTNNLEDAQRSLDAYQSWLNTIAVEEKK